MRIELNNQEILSLIQVINEAAFEPDAHPSYFSAHRKLVETLRAELLAYDILSEEVK